MAESGIFSIFRPLFFGRAGQDAKLVREGNPWPKPRGRHPRCRTL